ncbi:MAG: NAD(P)/FAD-dependent oxidoreductase [Oscillospiraceae bacterium]|nr:NAD(P)/FAD-dependent oxidoreductase [Oscillospiraceae bacterium]
MLMYDIVIIGAGITGAMLSWKLSRYRLKIAVLEKENDIAEGATMANSAIVHTGYDPEDGTLKAELNVRGAQQYEQICAQLHCAYKTVGAYIAACGTEEEEQLAVLAARADARGIPYRMLSRDEAIAEEPNLSEQVTRVLDFYTTAVIYPWEVADACMETACGNGTELYLNAPCCGITKDSDGFTVETPAGSFRTRYIINAAGVHAEQIHNMVAKADWHATPRKGEYYVLDQDAQPIRHIIFPVPSKEKGKGVLAIPTVYGNTLIGPNSDFLDDPDDNGTTVDGLAYVRANISKTLQNIPLNRSIRTFAGIRPTTTCPDFIVTELPDVPHFIDAVSIESPGLASSPAIADKVIAILAESLTLTENPDAVMTRKAPVVLAALSDAERSALIAENPAYGRIICRCEKISEGEIVDCIRKPCGARTVKGVKKRVRPGMGRCQGGFCEPKVVHILARELGISPLEVVYDSPKSNILESDNRI